LTPTSCDDPTADARSYGEDVEHIDPGAFHELAKEGITQVEAGTICPSALAVEGGIRLIGPAVEHVPGCVAYDIVVELARHDAAGCC
jgi:hypothetical protein